MRSFSTVKHGLRGPRHPRAPNEANCLNGGDRLALQLSARQGAGNSGGSSALGQKLTLTSAVATNCQRSRVGCGMSRTRSGAAITTPRRRRVTPKEYRAAFAARVRQARTAARYPINEMALLLGVTHDTYAKYEGRGASLMPHNLIVPFCLACRVSVEWLLTGIGAMRPRFR